MGSAHNICSYGQISISHTILCGSPCPYYYYLLLENFSRSVLTDGFSQEFEWRQVIQTRHPNSKSPSTFNNLLVTGPKPQITIGIIVTFLFQTFLIPLQGRGTYLSFYFPSALFCGQPVQQSPQFWKFSFFLFITIRCVFLAEIRWSNSHSNLLVSLSRTESWLYIFHLFLWSNLNFLHISQWITLPTLSSLVLYSFFANLLHSLIMWLIVSSLSSYNIHLLFCCVLIYSRFDVIGSYGVVLCCYSERICFALKASFLSQIQVLSSEMLFISRLKRPLLFEFSRQC